MRRRSRRRSKRCDDVVRAGKALYIGASSMYAWQFAKMLLHGRPARPRALRHHAEPLQPGLPRRRARDAAAVPRGGHRRHPVEPAGARLPGRQPPPRATTAKRSAPRPTNTRRSMYYQPSDFAVVERVTEIARQRGVSNAQVALAWLLAKPGVTAPIIGASKMQHLDDALAALTLTLDAGRIAGPRRALSAAPGAGPRISGRLVPQRRLIRVRAPVHSRLRHRYHAA